MNRLESFEKMLSDVKAQYEFEKSEMQKLQAAGKERTATYRQYFASYLFLIELLEKYKKYGLTD